MAAALPTAETTTNAVTDLGTIVVESTAISRYRPATVNDATFTDAPPEELPMVVDTLTEDYIREHNLTDLHDLLRYVLGIETGRRRRSEPLPKERLARQGRDRPTGKHVGRQAHVPPAWHGGRERDGDRGHDFMLNREAVSGV